MEKNDKNYILYENLKKNSIGNEKKCKAVKYIKKGTLRVGITVLISAFTIGVLSGCNIHEDYFNNNDNENNHSSYEQTLNDYNGFSIVEIRNYEMLRADDLFSNNGFHSYSMEGTKRKYNYKSSDYKRIKELDETYLYGIYLNTNSSTFNEVLQALGYSDLEDYLIKNNYVNKNGEPSTMAWSNADLEKMSQLMKIYVDKIESGEKIK